MKIPEFIIYHLEATLLKLYQILLSIKFVENLMTVSLVLVKFEFGDLNVELLTLGAHALI